MRLFYLFICMLFVAGCNSNGVPKDILPPTKMEEVMWDQIQADAFTREFILNDSGKNKVLENIKLQQKLFAKNNITKATFYKSYNYYLAHDKLLKDLLDSISAKQIRAKEKDDLKILENKKFSDSAKNIRRDTLIKNIKNRLIKNKRLNAVQ